MKTTANGILRSPSAVVDIPDLDVTPIMNMFIILIPFLVSMAVFTHLSILEFNLPANAGTNLDGSSGKPKLKLTIIVAGDHLAITHGEHQLDSLPVKNHSYDLEKLTALLEQHRTTLESNDEAVVAVRDDVTFKYVVCVMDQCRAAGFKKIGLSTATTDAKRGV